MNKKIVFLVLLIFFLNIFSAAGIEFIDSAILDFNYVDKSIHTPRDFFPINVINYYNNKSNDLVDVQLIYFNESERLDSWISIKVEYAKGTLNINNNTIFIADDNKYVFWRNGQTYIKITEKHQKSTPENPVDFIGSSGTGNFDEEIIVKYLNIYSSQCDEEGCKLEDPFKNDYQPTESNISLAQIDYEERKKHVKGITFSLNNIFKWIFEKLFGSKKHELSVEIIESVTKDGTHLRINGEDVYIPSGGTRYVDGWLVIHRGNIEDPNGTIYSDINSFYVGLDEECSLADHYKCIDNNLHWLYCNGTDYGMVEECDVCGDNECIKKGTFARYEKIRNYKENQSVSLPHEEGITTLNREKNDFSETAVSTNT